MIKATRTPKFIRKNEAVKVSMDGSTKELIEEYAAVTQCTNCQSIRQFVHSREAGRAEKRTIRRND